MSRTRRAAVSAGCWAIAAASAVAIAADAALEPASTAASAGATATAGTADAAAPLPMAPIAEGAYVYFGAQQDASPANRGAIANVGFIVGQRCVAVIDTGGSPAEGAQLRSALRAVTRLPVCAVINTHMHPDHVYGNDAFLAGHGQRDGGDKREASGRDPDFVGHIHLASALAARRDTYARAQERALGQWAGPTALVGPTLEVTPGHPVTLDLGDRSLEVRAWRTAHTDNDVTVFDPASGTLWAGDLLFAGRIPVIDGSLVGWLAVLDEIETMRPRQVVPGHGPVGDWKAALADQRRYLLALARETREAIRAHRSMAQAIEQVAAGERGRWLLFDEYHRRNIAAAYAELEWEE